MKAYIQILFIMLALQLGMLAVSAQTNVYLFTGAETNITLAAGTYNITAYGAEGAFGQGYGQEVNTGGLGAEISGEFSFSTTTTLILLVGGTGTGSGGAGGGGGGGSFVINGSIPLVIAGGGGAGGWYSGDIGGPGLIVTNGNGGGGVGYNGPGAAAGGGGYSGNGGGGGNGCAGGQSFINGGDGGLGDLGRNNGGFGGGGGGDYGGGGGGGYSGGDGASGLGGGSGGGSIIDSSAITNLAEVSGIASPDGSPHGEIIIVAVSTVSAPKPPALGISTYSNQPAVFFPTATGTNYVLQMTTNLANGPWVTVTNGVPISGLIITNPPAAAFFRLQ